MFHALVVDDLCFSWPDGAPLGKLEWAKERLTEAELAVHDDDEIRVDLPGTDVPAGRTA